MTIQRKTWTQRRWTKPGIDLLVATADPGAEPNAFYDSYALAPDPYTGVLKRAPAWTEAAALPAGFTQIDGAFFDEAGNTHCVIGRAGTPTALSLVYSDTGYTTWNATIRTLVAGHTLDGKPGRNVSFWGNMLWLIDDAKDVYRGPSYVAALTKFYDGGFADILCPMNDRMFCATTTGTIMRVLTDDSAFSDYHDPTGPLKVQFLAPFRQYLTVVTAGNDDTLNIFRLPDYAAHGLHQLARIPHPGYRTNTANAFALYDDQIWLLSGDQAQPASLYDIDVYAFNGSETRRAARIRSQPAAGTVASRGFLVWNNRLIFYDLDNAGVAGHTFKIHVGEGFVDYCPLAGVGGGGTRTCRAFAMGDYLIVTAYSGAADHVYYCRRDKLTDGYLITSRLDMGKPGQLKRLNTITVILDGETANFDVIVKYRLDNAPDWTTAITQDDNRIVKTADLKTNFYLLQIRVDLDDDTGANQDIGIQAISVDYSIDA
jgi:hypothetical protein